ncbi:gluconokinase, GntK/IdnK-type [Marinimicrobium sp. C6131]|uniref:gluconokinase n=1 Tax=Marinimicrobium sp. C6131 TaxID=3022676 RepID=UPI00223CC92F|nr:gluconokinase, GntK/IdnK-type [Marinimicrobium sp. C6131]UZJ46130.1 gluconokinase, GntK/IdnK-type [Marinimicrobium sp. C6131]
MATLLIMMGVSGAGKSTMASALSEHFGFTYLDADDFHSETAKAHMAAGKPLTDEMRAPWIARMCEYFRERADTDTTFVLAFSGLKRSHREPFRHCGLDTHFLFLDGDAATIADRISARQGHFMPPELLDSQFEALERPDLQKEPDVTPLNIHPPVPGVMEQAIDYIESLKARSD